MTAAAGELVWDLRFDSDSVGTPPKLSGLTDTVMLEKRDTPPSLPLTQFSSMQFILPTRFAVVAEDFCGIKGRSCQMVVNDADREKGSGRGPWLGLAVPPSHWNVPRWRLRFEIAAEKLMQIGGVSLFARSGVEICTIYFFRDGVIRAGMRPDPKGGELMADICQYRPNKPILFEIVVDGGRRDATFAIFVNGGKEPVLEAPWKKEPQGNMAQFTHMLVFGMTTGPHADTGRLAVSGIQLRVDDAAGK